MKDIDELALIVKRLKISLQKIKSEYTKALDEFIKNHGPNGHYEKNEIRIVLRSDNEFIKLDKDLLIKELSRYIEENLAEEIINKSNISNVREGCVVVTILDK